ncbi:hypothetical protein GCWU000341_01007 [Oribacterium sp. oral taxon 078 str. F0262]|nr:hypothetical protein GCWU000341_01007 [Oribacterium sp. oral taxon 078 str. F0262]
MGNFSIKGKLSLQTMQRKLPLYQGFLGRSAPKISPKECCAICNDKILVLTG